MKNTSLVKALLFITILLFSDNNLYADNPVKNYMDAWKELNSKARLKLIKTCWSSESIYEDPTGRAKGPEQLNAMIDKFHMDFKGTSMYADTVLATGNSRIWNWKIFDSKNKLMVSGRDIAILDKEGKIRSLVGFFDIADQAVTALTKSKEEEIKIVAKYFECLFKTGDFEAMQKIIAKDAVYNQAIGLPYGGDYVGFNEWIKMFTKAQTFFNLQIVEDPVYYTNNTNNGVFIYFKIKCTSKSSNKEISMPISEYYEVKDNLITNIRAYYFDTKSFVEFLQ